MSNTPPKGLISRFQMKTMLPPVTMPAMAPDLVTRFQKSEKSMMPEGRTESCPGERYYLEYDTVLIQGNNRSYCRYNHQHYSC